MGLIERLPSLRLVNVCGSEGQEPGVPAPLNRARTRRRPRPRFGHLAAAAVENRAVEPVTDTTYRTYRTNMTVYSRETPKRPHAETPTRRYAPKS